MQRGKMIGISQYMYRIEGHRNQRVFGDDIQRIEPQNTAICPLGDGYYVVYGWFYNENEATDWWEGYFR